MPYVLGFALLLVLVVSTLGHDPVDPNEYDEAFHPPAGYVLLIQAGRLVRLPTPMAPAGVIFHPAWEVNHGAAQRILIVDDDGRLNFYLWLDILGSACPYYLEVRVVQEPDGSIEMEAAVVDSCRDGPWFKAWSSRCYADIAGLPIIFDTTLADLLRPWADDHQPQDLDQLQRRNDTTVAPATRAEVWAWIAELDDDAFQVRERALRMLSGTYEWLPQLRAALRDGPLTANQRNSLELLTAPLPASPATLAALQAPR